MSYAYLGLRVNLALLFAVVKASLRRSIGTWWRALRKAHAYTPQHRYRYFQKNVTSRTPVREYNGSHRKAEAPTAPVPAPAPKAPRVVSDNPDADDLVSDPWMRFMNETDGHTEDEGAPWFSLRRLTRKAHDGTTPDLGRDQVPASRHDRQTQPVPPRTGGSDHHGHPKPHLRRRVQRPARRIRAPRTAMQYLVLATPFDFSEPGLHRLPDPAR
jgi:hypothetical protein